MTLSTVQNSIQPIAPAAGSRLRVLVSAYAMSPARGSEPGVGWHICRGLATHHDVTVLCADGTPGVEHDIYRQEIDAHIRRHGPIPGLTIHYVPRPAISRWFQREREWCRRTLYYAGYKAWQKSAYAVARRLHADKPFDVVHQLNITGFREPGYLWQLRDVPFVWGPVGGASNVPRAYLSMMDAGDRMFYAARTALNEVQKRVAWRCRRAAARAAHLWAIGEPMRRLAEDNWGCPAELMLETGTVRRSQARYRRRDMTRPLQVVWSGTHVGRKGLPILLHAMQKIGQSAPIQLAVLGGGPLTMQWRALAASLGLSSRVVFTGPLTQSEAVNHVSQADVLAFTSVQEGTPHAVLEALSLGVPVICHDACGMGVAVNHTCGLKLPMTSPVASVNGFADALVQLISDPELLGRLSAGALRRSRDLSWEAKVKRISDVYREVAANVIC